MSAHKAMKTPTRSWPLRIIISICLLSLLVPMFIGLLAEEIFEYLNDFIREPQP